MLGCFVDMNLTARIVVKSASVVSTSCDLLWGRVCREVTIPQPGVYEVQITIPELSGDRVIRTDTLDVRGGDASVEPLLPAPAALLLLLLLMLLLLLLLLLLWQPRSSDGSRT